MNNRVKNVAVGTLIAGAVGYVAGVLTAPKSGRETRKYLNRARTSGMVEAEKQLKKLHTELNQLLGEADKSKWTGTKPSDAGKAVEGEVVNKASSTRQKVRELLSALHDGSADDRDLDRAVAEASKAIKSIRDYLKK